MFNENYLEPIEEKIKQINQSKMIKLKELESILCNITDKKSDNIIPKLDLFTIEDLILNFPVFASIFMVYCTTTMTIDSDLKKRMDEVIDYIINQRNYTFTGEIEILKRKVDKAENILSDLSNTEPRKEFINELINYLNEKLSLLEKENMRYEFDKLPQDTKELIENLYQLEYIYEQVMNYDENLSEGFLDIFKKYFYVVSDRYVNKYLSKSGGFDFAYETPRDALIKYIKYRLKGNFKSKDNMFIVPLKNKNEFNKKIYIYKINSKDYEKSGKNESKTIEMKTSKTAILNTDEVKLSELCDKYNFKIKFVDNSVIINACKNEVRVLYKRASEILKSPEFKKFNKAIILDNISDQLDDMDHSQEFEDVYICSWDLWEYDSQARTTAMNNPEKHNDLWKAIAYIESELNKIITRKDLFKVVSDGGDWDGGFIELELINKVNESTLNEARGAIKDKILKTKSNIKVGVRNISNRIDSTWDRIFGEIKAAKTNEDRERLIKNSIPKLSSIIRKAVGTGLVALVNPALAAIGLFTKLVLDKRTKEVQRKLLLHELESELKIVEEKVRDADSESKKQKKYQLMRIQSKIERDIEKIRYNLKY